jgi:uncharacterized protein
MKLAFKEISKQKSRYALSNGTWLPAELSATVSDAVAIIVIYKKDKNSVALEGDLKGKRTAACDRCGDAVCSGFQISFSYVITTGVEEDAGLSEIECSDEKAQLIHIAAPDLEIDIDAILEEQTYLAIPAKTLCSEDCKGICPGCGAAMNSEKCLCVRELEGSPFAVLKNLVKK